MIDGACYDKLERSARDPETGKIIKVPQNMTYGEWYEKYVDKSADSGIIKEKLRETAAADVYSVGKIDIEKYKCVTEDIQTDEVIITDKQIEHIKERHPNDYERFSQYFKEIVKYPDFIIEANKPDTALILKEIE